ncbi:uncharacterized protein [Antedon mediterranea]|uniref:uncharacterized protein n=1 Tax=Antedon mediterranea TaxID=105859 RepID=UPI003AF567AE
MGGIWERQIRTVRNALAPLLNIHGNQLDDECFRTLLSEVMNIVNSRPLTVNNLNDPNSMEPLTPNHILTLKHKVVVPPPGIFQNADMYCRRRWRRVQHLSNEFWCRWRKEYLSSMQSRSKWTSPKRNFKVGDVVLLKGDNVPRNIWELAKVIALHPSDDGLVRKVSVFVGRRQSVLERPVHKLLQLVPVD